MCNLFQCATTRLSANAGHVHDISFGPVSSSILVVGGFEVLDDYRPSRRGLGPVATSRIARCLSLDRPLFVEVHQVKRTPLERIRNEVDDEGRVYVEQNQRRCEKAVL